MLRPFHRASGYQPSRDNLPILASHDEVSFGLLPLVVDLFGIGSTATLRVFEFLLLETEFDVVHTVSTLAF
jgi:hypothetical protein